METVSFNIPAVVCAALLYFVIGGLWYSPLLFSRSWQLACGLSDAQLQAAPKGRIFALSAIAALVIAFNLAAFIGAKSSIAFGLFAGGATGIGWVAMSLGVIYLFEQRPLKLWLINSGYQVVAYTLMGALLAGWK